MKCRTLPKVLGHYLIASPWYVVESGRKLRVVFDAAMENIKKLGKSNQAAISPETPPPCGSAEGCRTVISRLLKLLTNL